MKKINLILPIFCLLFFVDVSFAQTKKPDILYGELFKRVQMEQVLGDGKTFVDMVPKQTPQKIMELYKAQKNKEEFNLKTFVTSNFYLPENSVPQIDVKEHINQLWKILERKPDVAFPGSSLIPLPFSYIVPGGRFREVYYWDSYFTMLGLAESKEYDKIHNMIKNFAFLIDEFGHIPNGNRNYYISRSQPPFFAMMVELLAEEKGDKVYHDFLPQLLKEHEYWTSGNRLVKFSDGTSLSKYWDDSYLPRQESYREDVETAAKSKRDVADVYHQLRVGAASGWDFSSRWFKDSKNMESIQIDDIIPVDLNALLYRQEIIIAKALTLSKQEKQAFDFKDRAALRLKLIDKYCWNKRLDFYTDFNFKTNTQLPNITAAGLVPLFTIRDDDLVKNHIEDIKKLTVESLLKAGGIVTTTVNSGQQWDAPNGWAPLQWMAIKGFKNYGEDELAETIARRWIFLNVKVYKDTGKLMEKYNVENLALEAGGGEYESQDGFGWTNGVLLKLLNLYPEFVN